MKLAYVKAEYAGSEWREALAVVMDLGLPDFFNVEWLIDRAERSEWSGPWW